jgi:hypothetical protein
MTTTYEVPESNLPWLREKIVHLNKRAEKLGVAPISLRIVSERLVDVPRTRARDAVEASLIAIEGSAGVEAMRVLKIEVEGEAPVLAGWRFIATLQHVSDNGDSATIIHAVPGETVPTQYRDTDGRWCDHCRTKRVRNDTFIVQQVEMMGHDEPNYLEQKPEYQQVGRQCLRDFLGHPKPEMYADWAESLGLLHDLFKSAEHEYNPNRVYDRIFRTDGYIATVAAAIRTFGWVSGKMAHEAEEKGDYLTRTRDVATVHILSAGDVAASRVKLTVTKDDYETALKVIAWGRDALPAKVARQPENDYLYNLSQVLRLDALNYRMLGIAASAVVAWQKDAAPRATDADRASQSKYVGEPGVRAQFIVQVSGIRSIQYRDGTSGTVIEFTDDEGNEMVWFTSGRGTFEPGKTYRVKATVKRHSEFRGIKQTGLNRVQIMEVVA